MKRVIFLTDTQESPGDLRLMLYMRYELLFGRVHEPLARRMGFRLVLHDRLQANP